MAKPKAFIGGLACRICCQNESGKRWFLTLTLLASPFFSVLAGQSESDASLLNESLSELEQRVVAIDERLGQLARFSMRSGMGSIGFRSQPHSEANHTEWIQIDLPEEKVIDQIVLVPSIWQDARAGFRADGFPLEFRLLAKSAENPAGKVVASFGPAKNLLPRIAPLVIPCPPGTVASEVVLEVTTLSPRAWDGKYLLQLSEILIFNGEENVALRQKVTTSKSIADPDPSRFKEALVDGFLPFEMDAAFGEPSLAMVGKAGLEETPQMVIDLGSIQILSWLQLHRTDISDSVPQAVPSDFGVPRRLLIEGAGQPDFSDAVLLVDYRNENVYDTGPIIMRSFPETRCRYVRLTVVEPYQDTLLGLAEIELFSSEGENVAINLPVQTNIDVISRNRSISALTDGRNIYGEILPIREWVSQLAERHDLEVEKPLVVAELGRRYSQQKANLRRMSWLAAILVAGIVVSIFLERIVRMRQISNIRKRLAADLHDELGANLHTIGLLSDMAGDSRTTSEELATIHRRIRSETERSGMAVRHCADVLVAGNLYTDLVADMRRASRRIIAKASHNFSCEGEEFLARLRPRARADLFLFYKECLVNISRHSGATQYTTHLSAGPKEVCLTIKDNGQGVPIDVKDGIPPSLLRRAWLLRGKISVEGQGSDGTSINLKVKIWRWRLRK